MTGGAGRARAIASNHPVVRRRGRAVAVSALLSLSLADAGRSPGSNDRTIDDLERLRATLGSTRLFEPRLSGSVGHGPFDEGTGRNAAPLEARALALRLERAGAAGSPVSSHALGLALLVSGQVDAAVDALTRASADRDHLGSDRVDIFTDLSAALIVRARDRGSVGDYARGLDAAVRAQLADAMAADAAGAAAFNEALALEALGAHGLALDAWQAASSGSQAAPWRAEARTRLDALRGKVMAAAAWATHRTLALGSRRPSPDDADRLVGLSRQGTREIVEDDLLPLWAASLQTDPPRADALLATMLRLSAGLVHARGDRMPAEVVNRLVALGPGDARREVASTLQVWGRARSMHEEGDIQRASPLFAAARDRFAAHAIPLEAWCWYYLGVAAYYRGSRPEALALLDDADRRASARGYVALQGRIAWMRALVHAVDNRFADALYQYDRARERFAVLGETGNVATLGARLATLALALNDHDLMWRHLREGLEGVLEIHNPRVAYSVLTTAARAVADLGLGAAALRFAVAAVRRADDFGQPLEQAEARLGLARAWFDLGRPDRAREALAEARVHRDRITDRSLAERLAVDFTLEEAWRGGDDGSGATASIAALSSAIEFASGARLGRKVSELLLLRGRAHRAAGDVAAATADYTHGIEVFERQIRTLSPSMVRGAFGERSWQLFADLIDLILQTSDDARAALAVADRMRERAPVQLQLAARQLRKSERVVYYHVRPADSIVWVIDADRTRARHLPAGQRALEDAAQSVLDAIRSPGPTADDALEHAYDLAIGPVADLLRGATSLVFVPDGPLHRVPFAALRNPATGASLLATSTVSVSPGLVSLAAARQRTRARSADAPTPALVIGAPAAAEGLFSSIQALPGAGSEAADVAAVYPGSRLLRGASATRRAFLDAAPGASVIHFAGHAVPNPDYPALGALLFATDPASTSRPLLLGHELAATTLRSTKLVVLAACRTGAGPTFRGDGPTSLGRSFLDAGVSTVLATLWDIRDDSARELFGWIHEAIARGLPPADALRSAQLKALASSDPVVRSPATWAAVQLIGDPDWGLPGTLSPEP
jgi:CHAT domain-containing protein